MCLNAVLRLKCVDTANILREQKSRSTTAALVKSLKKSRLPPHTGRQAGRQAYCPRNSSRAAELSGVNFLPWPSEGSVPSHMEGNARTIFTCRSNGKTYFYRPEGGMCVRSTQAPLPPSQSIPLRDRNACFQPFPVELEKKDFLKTKASGRKSDLQAQYQARRSNPSEIKNKITEVRLHPRCQYSIKFL